MCWAPIQCSEPSSWTGRDRICSGGLHSFTFLSVQPGCSRSPNILSCIAGPACPGQRNCTVMGCTTANTTALLCFNGWAGLARITPRASPPKPPNERYRNIQLYCSGPTYDPQFNKSGGSLLLRSRPVFSTLSHFWFLQRNITKSQFLLHGQTSNMTRQILIAFFKNRQHHQIRSSNRINLEFFTMENY